MRLSELFKTSVNEGARFDSMETTKALRKYCLDNNWPAEVVNNLSIINDSSKYTIYYPDFLTSKVNDLEFGTQNNAPSGTLRRFLEIIDDSPYANGILRRMFS